MPGRTFVAILAHHFVFALAFACFVIAKLRATLVARTILASLGDRVAMEPVGTALAMFTGRVVETIGAHTTDRIATARIVDIDVAVALALSTQAALNLRLAKVSGGTRVTSCSVVARSTIASQHTARR